VHITAINLQERKTHPPEARVSYSMQFVLKKVELVFHLQMKFEKGMEIDEVALPCEGQFANGRASSGDPLNGAQGGCSPVSGFLVSGNGGSYPSLGWLRCWF